MNESKGSKFGKDIATSKNGKHLGPKKASGMQVKSIKEGNMPRSTSSQVKVCMSKFITYVQEISTGFNSFSTLNYPWFIFFFTGYQPRFTYHYNCDAVRFIHSSNQKIAMDSQL